LTGVAGPQGSQGDPGTTGQDVQSALSTTAAAFSAGAGCIAIPNFSLTVPTPANGAIVVATADGSVQNNQATVGNALVEFMLTIDNVAQASSRHRLTLTNASSAASGAAGNWSITRMLVLDPAAPSHTIGVCGQMVTANGVLSASSGLASATPVSLTLVTINK
jgi:hypothetical protein